MVDYLSKNNIIPIIEFRIVLSMIYCLYHYY